MLTAARAIRISAIATTTATATVVSSTVEERKHYAQRSDMHREETLYTHLPEGPDKPDEGEPLAKESPTVKQSSKWLLTLDSILFEKHRKTCHIQQALDGLQQKLLAINTSCGYVYT